jgi:hypothetical protein
VSGRRALVIGIDEYPFAPLTSCVRDAKQMFDKLVQIGAFDPKADEITLMLAPKTNDAPIPTRRAILTYLLELYKRADPLDRLLFYFAGHGISARTGRGVDRLHTVLVPAEVIQLVDSGDDLLDLDELLARFARRGAREQFWIVDACRNMPDQAHGINPMAIGWDRPDMNDPRDASEMAQAALYAVAPLGEAQAVQAGHGAFTARLFEGLDGCGRAAYYNEEKDAFQVDARSLMDYAAYKIGAAIPPGDWRREYMMPRIWTSEIEPGPLRELGQLPDREFSIQILPGHAARAVSVNLSQRRHVLQAWPPLASGQPVFLLPDRYRVTAQLTDTTSLWSPPEPANCLVDLREVNSLEVRVNPRTSPPPTTQVPNLVIRSTGVSVSAVLAGDAVAAAAPLLISGVTPGLGSVVTALISLAASTTKSAPLHETTAAMSRLRARLPRSARSLVVALEREPSSSARQQSVVAALDSLDEKSTSDIVDLAQVLVKKFDAEAGQRELTIPSLVRGDVNVGAPSGASTSVSSSINGAPVVSPAAVASRSLPDAVIQSENKQTADLAVEASDPGARVRLTRLSGGRGIIVGNPGQVFSVAPGLWHIDVLIGDDVVSSAEEDLAAGDICSVEAAAQITPALAALMPEPEREAGVAASSPPRILVPSESIGPMQGAILPTLLPLLAIKPYDHEQRVLQSFSPRLQIPRLELPELHGPWDGLVAAAVAFDGAWDGRQLAEIKKSLKVCVPEPISEIWRDPGGRVILFGEERYPKSAPPRVDAIIQLHNGNKKSVAAPRLPGFVTVISMIVSPDGRSQIAVHLFEVWRGDSLRSAGPLARAVTIGSRLVQAGIDIDMSAPRVFTLLEDRMGLAPSAPGLAALAWFSRSRLMSDSRLAGDRHKALSAANRRIEPVFHYLPLLSMPDVSIIYALSSDTPERWLDSLLESEQFGQPVYADAVVALARRAMATDRFDHRVVDRFRRLPSDAVFNSVNLDKDENQ